LRTVAAAGTVAAVPPSHPEKSSMKYRLAIFDFDGTLADSLPWFRSVFNRVATRYGFRTLDDAEFEELRGMGNREIIRRVGVPLWKIPLIAAHMKRQMAEDIDGIALFDGAAEMLLDLKSSGMRLAVVSSNSEGNIRRVLGRENAALIDHYGCGASIFGKPPKFRQVLRRSGVRAHEAICIGDEVRDAEAARSLGIPFAAVSWGYATPELLASQEPDQMFVSVGDITRAIRG
jgi:phosphoglycolate phosphatase